MIDITRCTYENLVSGKYNKRSGREKRKWGVGNWQLVGWARKDIRLNMLQTHINRNEWTYSIQDKPITLRLMPAPNQTSPDTFRLMSSIMLGIDLNLLKKLPTYRHHNKSVIIPKDVMEISLQVNLHLLKLRAQFNWRIRGICSSLVSDNKTIFQSI